MLAGAENDAIGLNSGEAAVVGGDDFLSKCRTIWDYYYDYYCKE